MSIVETRDGQAPEPGPLTVADLLDLIADIRRTLARVEAMLGRTDNAR